MTKIKIKEELWDIVEEALKNEKASAYKMAVIEADKTLDNLMTLKGVPGTSTKDRALKIKEHFSDIRKLMEAFDIKEKILHSVKEKSATYASLERRVNTGYRTIKSNCEELQHFGQIKIEEQEHPKNGKPAHIVSITEKGLETLKRKK